MKRYTEALDLPDKGKYFHPQKVKYVEKLPQHEKDVVEALYPDLGPDAQRYLELITSNSYKHAVAKLAKYLNLSIEEMHKTYPNFSSLYSIILQNYLNIQQIEKQYKEELQILAVETVLELPEFKMIKQMVDDGLITIDAQLDTPDLTNAITKNELKTQNPNKLTTQEKDTEQLSKEFVPQLEVERPEVLARRSFFRTLTQGFAANKFYLFHLVERNIKDINPDLLKMYGIVCAGTHLSYYGLPMIELNRAVIEGGASGSVDVDESSIVAKGQSFPVLMYELVKGIYNWLTYSIANQAELNKETLDQEVLEILSGTSLADNFNSLIDVENQYLIPLIIKDLSTQSVDVIKALNLGGMKAKQIMDKLVENAKVTYKNLQ